MSLAENASTLYELGKLPEDIVKRLKEGGSFLETLQSKQANFHKSCRSKYNKTIIDRIKKTSSSNAATSSRQGLQAQGLQQLKFVFFAIILRLTSKPCIQSQLSRLKNVFVMEHSVLNDMIY